MEISTQISDANINFDVAAANLYNLLKNKSIFRKICVKLNPAVRNFFIVLQNRLEARHLSTMGSCSGKLKSVSLSAELYFPL